MKAAMRALVPLAVMAGAAGAFWPALWPAGSSVPDYSPPPGAINPQVTQANIGETVCVRGWTRTVRPPASYTGALKRQQIAARHLPGGPASYEEDHLIPLELGGAPTDPKNLWPQAWSQARVKDRLEYGLNRAVCAGRMSLDAARREVQDPAAWGSP